MEIICRTKRTKIKHQVAPLFPVARKIKTQQRPAARDAHTCVSHAALLPGLQPIFFSLTQPIERRERVGGAARVVLIRVVPHLVAHRPQSRDRSSVEFRGLLRCTVAGLVADGRREWEKIQSERMRMGQGEGGREAKRYEPHTFEVRSKLAGDEVRGGARENDGQSGPRKTTLEAKTGRGTLIIRTHAETDRAGSGSEPSRRNPTRSHLCQAKKKEAQLVEASCSAHEESSI